MSTQTLTPAPAPAKSAPLPQRTKKVTFARVMNSEWIKFRSLRSTRYTLAAGVLSFMLLGLIIAYATRNAADLPPEALAPSTTLGGYFLAQLLIGVLGVLFVSGEYGTGMIRSTVAAVPRRTPVLLAKSLVFAAVVMVSMVATSLITFLGAQAFFAQYDRGGYSLSDPTVVRVVVGVGVYLALIGLFGSALGWILRSTPGAISALLGLLLVVPVILQLVPGQLAKDLFPYLPGPAGESFIASVPGPEMLSAWTGLGVLVAWVVAALLVAGIQLKRRDA